VDVENNASHFLEFGMAFESLRGREQDGFVVVLLKQSFYCPQHREVIIDN